MISIAPLASRVLATLNALSGKLSDEVLQGLNAKVDVDKTPIEEVARQFLAESGLN